MALGDYEVENDCFKSSETIGLDSALAFPCCVCIHNSKHVDALPCRNCGHNVNSDTSPGR